ncbi:hypothetical protein IW146_008631 [Coemansia sp. RSA 922]|nr:hypothetical protein IW146_008631 [Coemansia sp. RSA 922]
MKSTNLEKYIFLSWLRTTNINLFYRLVLHNLKAIAPVIYTPTVGQACQEYSHIYPFLAPPNNVDGLYIPLTEVENIGEIIGNYRESIKEGDEPEITVITDGSRILGLGDLASLNEQEKADGELYPRIERIREVSAELAAAFIRQAVNEGLAKDQMWISMAGDKDLVAEVRRFMWLPAETFEQLRQCCPHTHHHPVMPHHHEESKL